MPDAIPPSISFLSLYELTAASYRLAQDYLVENDVEVFSLAVAACFTNGGSYKNAELYRLLENRAWRDGNLGEEMLRAGIV